MCRQPVVQGSAGHIVPFWGPHPKEHSFVGETVYGIESGKLKLGSRVSFCLLEVWMGWGGSGSQTPWSQDTSCLGVIKGPKNSHVGGLCHVCSRLLG